MLLAGGPGVRDAGQEGGCGLRHQVGVARLLLSGGPRRSRSRSSVTDPSNARCSRCAACIKITSESYYGLSKIQVELDPATPAAEIPQLWDELRRKVLNVQPKLPAGASQITVADDFGDVYGIYYGLSVDGGFTWSELRAIGRSAQNGPRDDRRRAEGDPLRRTDARGERLRQHGDAGPISPSVPKPSSRPSASRIPSSTAGRSRPENSRYRFSRRDLQTLDDLSDQLLISTFRANSTAWATSPASSGLRRAAADDDAR